MRNRIAELIERWPVARQLRSGDFFGRGETSASRRTRELQPHIEEAELVHVKHEKVVNIEGDPDSPISRGRLCPKGAATRSLVTGNRLERVLYRRPHGTTWEEIGLDQAMDMIADRVIATRRNTWEDRDEQGRVLHRTLGFAHLGGATLDNEENYLLKKLYTALGALQIENQARI